MPTGASVGALAYIAATLSLEGFSVVGQAIDPGYGLSTLFTQLGVFAVVVVVFKFMLNRQDVRDTLADAKEADTLTRVREELLQERIAHEQTRHKLYDALSKIADYKER